MSDTDFPPPDSFQGADETVFPQGLDRRRVIKFGTVAAGAAFLTPTILTLGASPASASGMPSDQSASASNSANVTTLTTSALSAPVGIVVATVSLQSNDQVITANESGWTALTRTATASATGAARNCTQVFYRYYNTAQADQTYKFSWPAGCAAAVSIVKFENATTVVEASTPALSPTGTSRAAGSVTPSVPSGAIGPPSILFSLGYSRSSGSPTPSAPSDGVNGTYTEYAVGRNNNVGSQMWAVYPAAVGSSVAPAVTSMFNTRSSVATALVIT